MTTTTIRKAKAQARHYRIAVWLGLLLLAFETVNRAPKVVKLALLVATIYAVVWIDAHRAGVLGILVAAVLLVIAYRIARAQQYGSAATWRNAREWARTHRQDVKSDTHYEFANGTWHERTTHDDIPW